MSQTIVKQIKGTISNNKRVIMYDFIRELVGI